MNDARHGRRFLEADCGIAANDNLLSLAIQPIAKRPRLEITRASAREIRSLRGSKNIPSPPMSVDDSLQKTTGVDHEQEGHHSGSEYAFREKRKPGTPFQHIQILQDIRNNKWKSEWLEPNPGLITTSNLLRLSNPFQRRTQPII